MNQTMKESWEDFKKELTWNNIKICISAGIPMMIGAWFYIQWLNILRPIAEQYTLNDKVPMSQEHAIISLCIIMAYIMPVWPLFLWSSYGGMELGKIIKFFRDDKTRRVWWDNKYYFVRDMPKESREQVAKILEPFKTKEQKRRDSKQQKNGDVV